ncbi:serine hydrolase domain-containing protein [Chitinophaga nivalis]|uniref:Beta-lactamase family protein n=1 Tax=Chitinophaga nivalis TaxID=2991709 RepID=A0ABT3IQC3_9BACT|nr:serine hydrolase domain-containing protein [Chitinophaga nivalis]MCW3464130.1 beta-lactamase family protein [Chitinophaga nivalis]MCW3486180.1 beta-lactamase family protein [Chitinophaga nivalis]
MMTYPFLLLWSCLSNSPTADSTLTIPQVDRTVHAYMQRYQVPGMAVAITLHGKLVYAKGYGQADTTQHTPVTPASLFRIASVSKSITAVAILKLVSDKKLSLNDLVFGPKGRLGIRYGHRPYSPYLRQVTIRHLLQHTAGGWTNNARDPMFLYPQLTADSLISRILDTAPLQHRPGAVYAYSNFGYCILARIIEKVTGMSYEQYVQTALLAPAGISTMQIGGNTVADRKPGEVTYYGQQQEQPYIYNITRMDGHGGWIASATDLARFLVRVDGFATPPDLLDRTTLRLMTTPSAANPSYAAGWLVNAWQSWWHAGALPGTASEIVRTARGFNWVVLCNTRSDKGFFNDLDGLIWEAVNDPATRWPEADLF